MWSIPFLPLLRKKYALHLQFWSPHKEDGFKKREGERGTSGESHISIHTLLCVDGQLKGSTAPWAQSGAFCDDTDAGMGQGREAPEGAGICVITARSRYYTAETNTTV